ncbi:MAG: hypothetical protein WCP45_08415 [Verrucomicrobiota bacterium]
MLKRPLNPRFSRAVKEGRKVTTIRNFFWPCDVPIMLYCWSGAAYRSKHLDVAPVIVESVCPINITHREDGGMIYAYGPPGERLLHETEGFKSREEMDSWFRPLVKQGHTVTKFLMRFRLLNVCDVPRGAADPSSPAKEQI